MEVFAIGSVVKIGQIDDSNNWIDGQITGILIRNGNIQYEVAWWDGNTRNTAWMESVELDSTKAEIQKIGIKVNE